MAKARDFFPDRAINDMIVEERLQHAASEIYMQYGHRVKINRKTLRKYGKNNGVTTSEHDINNFNTGSYLKETWLSSNDITTVSSSDGSDSGTIFVEGMTRDSTGYTFVRQDVTLNGQNKVTLDTPLAAATRARGSATGTVYVYEDGAITAGVPDDLTTVHAQIEPLERASLKASTAIAKNNYFLIAETWATLGKSAGSAAVEVRLRINNLFSDYLSNGDQYTEELRTVSISSPMENKFEPYDIIIPNSVVVMTGEASSGTVPVNAGFSGYFADIVN